MTTPLRFATTTSTLAWDPQTSWDQIRAPRAIERGQRSAQRGLTQAA